MSRTRSAKSAPALLLLVAAITGCGSIYDQAPNASGYTDGNRPGDTPIALDPGSEEPATGGNPGTVFGGTEPDDEDVAYYEAEEPVLIWKAGNDGAIDGGGGTPPSVVHDAAYYVTQVCSYHWNGGEGTSEAGTISLRAADGTIHGPWQTSLVNGVYWCAEPGIILPAGTYTLTDSDPATWAQNSASGGQGMGWAYGVPAK